MTTSPAGWYPDPTGRFQHRYWDGIAWTEHVATAGIQDADPPTMPVPPSPGRRRGGILLTAGVVLGVLAIAAAAVPFVWSVRAIGRDGVALPSGAHTFDLPAHTTYGVYVDDEDNSGYSERCSASDPAGRAIALRDPSWNIGWFSETETLDYVFDTGSGQVTVECDVPGETVTLREVPNDVALIMGGLVGSLLFAASVVLLVVGAIRRSSSSTAVRRQ